MKPAAVILSVAILINAIIPALSYAAQPPRIKAGAVADDDSLVTDHAGKHIEEEREGAKATRPPRKRIAPETVRVMTREDLDPSKIKEGWHAHVIYTSKGKETATGRIVDRGETRVEIRDWSKKWKPWKIAYEAIDTIAVSERRQDIVLYLTDQEEVLKKWLDRRVRTVTRGGLDLSKMTKGDHVYVVYTAKGVRNVAAGQIVSTDAARMQVRDWEAIEKSWTVAYDDIDTLAVGESRQDIL